MTTITLRPVKEAFKRAVDVYADAMRPVIVRNLRRVRGETLQQLVERALLDNHIGYFRSRLREEDGNVEHALDFGWFPHIIRRHWREAFAEQFQNDYSVQNTLWTIKDARNSAEHGGPRDMDPELADAGLDSMADVLRRVNNPDAANAIESIRNGLSAPPADAAPQLAESMDGAPQLAPEPQPRRAKGILPWRDVIKPNDLVSQGMFEQAEFAADLQQVYAGRADATLYGSPVSFFEQTYITPGLRKLIANTLRRLSARGGDPVIQTKTGFGGGKTHSLIALYHLANDPIALLNPSRHGSRRVSDEIRAIMQNAGVDPDAPIEAKVAVLDGTYLAETDSGRTPDGDPLNTLWGVMAYQLGGQEAYEIVGAAARSGAAPGGQQLDALFESVGPCVILVDELVAYARNADGRDRIYTFIQNLTQSARRIPHVALVVTLPESAVEAGGEIGEEVLARLGNILGRIESLWEPLEINEAFEVVRRRLFDARIDEDERDSVCEAFSRMYSRNGREYPDEAREAAYLKRLKDCYPIHPEIFDRLYEDWAAIPRFQRTRGVLRMLATCISRLHLDGDRSPLIMPADLKLGNPALFSEFINILGERWRPVLTEADSDGSITDRLDASVARYRDVGGAARRTARAIALGSAPSGNIRGIDEKRIHLAVVQPGQGVSDYNEARNRMTQQLYYLYSDEGRFYFHVEPNLNQIAADRAGALDPEAVNDAIRAQMVEAVGRTLRADVAVFPRDSEDVSESDSVRLVILDTLSSLPSRVSEKDDAERFAQEILAQRGDAPRINKNTLLFLAARRDGIRNLRRAARRQLAWSSIARGDNRVPNLEGDRRRQAIAGADSADQDFRAALVNAYRWTLAPIQPDPLRAEYELVERQSDAREHGDIVQAAFRALADGEALVETLAPSVLGVMLDRYIWSRGQDHINIDALWDMLTANVYMHRLENKGVLIDCIARGTPERAFGVADDDSYDNLRFGEPLDDGPLSDDIGRKLLINPVMADLVEQERREEERRRREEGQDDDDPPAIGTEPGAADDDEPESEPSRVTQVIIGKKFDGDISLDAISDLSNEIIRTMRDGGAEVAISVTVSATRADGFADNILSALRQNADALGLAIEVVHGPNQDLGD